MEQHIELNGQLIKLSPVVSKKSMGTGKVYDIEVKDVHNYYANGINVHNCEYHELLAFYANKYDDENLLRVKDTFINYKHRSLVLHPSGPSKRTLRGATRILTAIDEIGWFDNNQGSDTKERASALEVYTALDRSLKTVRIKSANLLAQGYNNIPGAFALNISSPSSHTDKIMSLVRTHENSKEVYTVHLPTWEFNPMYKRKDFDKEYRDNPVTAERDFGASPPLNESPFLANMAALERVCSDTSNRVTYKYVRKAAIGGDNQVYRYAKIVNCHSPITAYSAVLAIDAGYANNSFGLAVGHVDNDGTAVLDVLVEIAPRKGQDVINYNKVFKEIVVPLIEKMNVQYMVADRWQSIKLLQDVEEECGIRTAQVSLKYADFFFFRDHLLAEEDDLKIEFPKPEMDFDDITDIDIDQYPHIFAYKPVSHLLFQCMTIVDTGKTIDKGPGFTDDLFRATALLFTHLLDDEFVSLYLVGKKRMRAVALGAMAGISGGGGGSGQASKMGAVGSLSGGSGGGSGGSAGAFSSRGR